MTSSRTRPVQTLTREDADRAMAVIVAAFAADPVTRWVFPNADQYATYFPPFAAAFAGGAFDHGSAFATEGGAGVALWLPPGVHSDSEAMGAIIEESLENAANIEDVIGFSENQASLHPQFEHMYLPFIAVDPTKQGSGVGSALLSHSLRICDERGLPAYLEATSMRSRALYERHGFEAIGEIQFGASPVMWPMLRQPR